MVEQYLLCLVSMLLLAPSLISANSITAPSFGFGTNSPSSSAIASSETSCGIYCNTTTSAYVVQSSTSSLFGTGTIFQDLTSKSASTTSSTHTSLRLSGNGTATNSSILLGSSVSFAPTTYSAPTSRRPGVNGTASNSSVTLGSHSSSSWKLSSSQSSIPATASSLSITLDSAASATGTPAITPPPSGSSGALPVTIPASGSKESQIAVTFNGETYVLPHTTSVELLQTDGSIITLRSDAVVSETATITIAETQALQTSLSNNGFAVQAGPAAHHSPDAGGLSGFAALIKALEGLAGDANAVVNSLDAIGKQGVLWAAGSVSDAAFSSSVGGLFDSAISDLSSFTSTMSGTIASYQAEEYEMTDDGLRRIFTARTGAVEELDLLTSLRKLVRGLTTLRNDVVLKAKDYWKQGTAAALALAAAEESLRNLGSYDWSAELPRTTSSSQSSTIPTSSLQSTKSRSSSSASVSASASATPYWFSTKEGTDLSIFQNFIKTLPDAGQGYQIVYDAVPWQSYVTNITAAEAKSIEAQSFVAWVYPVLVSEGNSTEDFSSAVAQEDQGLDKRATENPNLDKRATENLNLDYRLNSDNHLRLVSAGFQRFFPDIDESSPALPEYSFDPTLGEGQTIYILDSGFRVTHEDFAPAGRSITTYVVPNRFTLEGDPDPWAAEDITDYSGHGTAVARYDFKMQLPDSFADFRYSSVAGGISHGVASKANLVLVKLRNAAVTRGSQQLKNRFTRPSALEDAWDWVFQDIANRRKSSNPGKFIVNMSWGLPKGGGQEEVMERVLARCWRDDIITAVATGNDGNIGHSLDETTPQNLGRADNALITVGSVDGQGYLYPETTFDRGLGGSISTYAQGVGVVAAGHTSDTATAVRTGSSFACPAVAGIAAYFAGISSLDNKWRSGSVAQDMKDYIVKRAYVRHENPIPAQMPAAYNPIPPKDSILVAYNGFRDELCSDGSLSKRTIADANSLGLIKRQNQSNEIAIVLNGTVVLPSYSQSYCMAASSSASANKTTISSTTAISSSTAASSSSIMLSSTTFQSTTREPSSSVSDLLSNLPTLSSASYCTEVLSNGHEVLHTKTGSSCTYNTVEPTSTTTTSSASPSPTIDTDDGILTCGTRTDQGNSSTFFTLGDAQHALEQFCQNMTNNIPPIVYEPGLDVVEFGVYVPPDNVAGGINVSAVWNYYGAPDFGEGCPVLNMSMNEDGQAYKLCEDRINNVINGCDTQSHDLQYWKQGGQFYRDCITWEMTSVNA